MALELLSKPSLLFLDEPTSGLDPGLDKSVMEMMAGLAHDGRTVIVVTHSVANLDLCDRLLVLVPGGKVAFFGPPRDGLRHFGQPGWAEVFQAFEAEPDRDWAGEFRRSPLCAQYVTGEMAAAAATPARLPVRPRRRRDGATTCPSSPPCAGVTWPSSRRIASTWGSWPGARSPWRGSCSWSRLNRGWPGPPAATPTRKKCC